MAITDSQSGRAIDTFRPPQRGWTRLIIYSCAIVLCILNACGHTLATIFGRTVNTVHFSRPAPGFISAPILVGAGIYALVQLRNTGTKAGL